MYPRAVGTILYRERKSFWELRRVFWFERLAAAGVSIMLSPLLLAVAFGILIVSGCSPLVAVLRVGRFGEPLWMLKFRTMWTSSTRGPLRLIEYVIDETGPSRKGPGDDRVVCGFARFCRKYSVDEVPQFWHVVCGKMSFAGPRPMTAAELKEHYGASATEILSVRPGLTGMWQVSGRNTLDYEERRRLDLWLVRNMSFVVYLKLLVRTVAVVVTGRGAW